MRASTGGVIHRMRRQQLRKQLCSGAAESEPALHMYLYCSRALRQCSGRDKSRCTSFVEDAVRRRLRVNGAQPGGCDETQVPLYRLPLRSGVTNLSFAYNIASEFRLSSRHERSNCICLHLERVELYHRRKRCVHTMAENRALQPAVVMIVVTVCTTALM